MLADFFTKPLQGSLFHIFRDVIMGYTSIEELVDKLDTSLKIRVGDEKVKVVSNYPANSNTTNGKQIYVDVVLKNNSDKDRCII